MMSFRLTVAALAAGIMIASTAFAQSSKPVAPAAPAAPPAPPAAVVAAPVALPRVNINDPSITANHIALLKGAAPIASTIFAKLKASIATNGAFIYKEDLVKYGVVPPALFPLIKDQVVLVDLNNTCKTDLHAILDGIGPDKADGIFKLRATKPYTKIEDVMNVKGIAEGTFAKISDEITVTPRSAQPWPCLAKQQ